MLTLIFENMPVLSTSCQLDSLLQRSKPYLHNPVFRELLGVSFNNEIYFHLSKGLLPQDLLEMLSSQTELSSSTCVVAPCMFLKQIWDTDPEYKAYFEQIFANLHDTFARIVPNI